MPGRYARAAPTRIFSRGFCGGFCPAYLPEDIERKITGKTGTAMKRHAAILLACTFMTAAGPLLAGVDVAPVEDEFIWTDLGAETPAAAPEAPAATPLLDRYPMADAPAHAVPEGGLPRYLDDNRCGSPDAAPDPRVFGGAPGYYGDGGALPEAFRGRRGEMTGDDGVLEAMQDDPCALLFRRGGPTAESLREYTHPDDIRRANTLEERRIPIHEIGRYAPAGSGLWYREEYDPFLDTARIWTVERGKMLSEVLLEWGDAAGYDVVWQSPHDYVIQADVHIRGTFPEAAGQVIESFADANPPIAADFYLSNKVLVVDSAQEFDGR